MNRRYAFALVFTATLSAATASVRADEGMWTFDNFPSAEVEARYGFTPDASWLDRVQRGLVRLGGCTGGLVSPDGLVMTNYHCVSGCVQRLNRPDRDVQADGWVAASRGDELACPGMAVDQLVGISDVTAEVQAATKGLEGAAFNDALRAERAKIESACSTGEGTRCDLVPLYRGGLYHLYRYRRWNDVRLAFAPEFDAAFFGGDLDNFMFPRWNLDAAFLRVWEDGKPAVTPDYFKWTTAGAREGDLVFVPGNPGSTSRLDTVAELEFERDVELPRRIPYSSELRGVLGELAARVPQAEKAARAESVYVDNGLKVLRGRQRALLDGRAFARKAAAESELRGRVASDPKLAALYGDAWDAVAAAMRLRREIDRRATWIGGESGFRSDLFSWARTLVRAATELPKPSAERLAEFADARLARLKTALTAPKPVDRDVEVARLSFSLEKLREALGPDEPFVKRVLGARAPREAAAALVAGSRLDDVSVRKTLLDGGRAAIETSDDPMIRLAAAIDADARAAQKEIEDSVDAVVRRNTERIARARFAVYGTSVYPEATFSPRLSFGTVAGWTEEGRAVKPFTALRGLYDRATGRPPFRLPARWLDAKARLDLDVPFDFVTTNDVIGGNSGSAVIDRGARVVGVAFDGNIHAIAGDYWFDPERARTVVVDARAILEALDKVYAATRLATEIRESAK